MMNCKKKKGFTLVELLVVIAIIGILAAVGVTALSGARAKARDAKRVADMKQVQSGLELYYNDKAGYPGEADPAALGKSPNTILCSGATTTGFVDAMCTGDPVATYMGMVPKDPQSTDTTSACTASSTATCDYGYESDATTVFQIYFWLEAPTSGLNAGLNCANQNGIKSGATCP